MADVIKAMITGEKELFQLALDGKARKYAFANVIMVGALFGLSNLYGTLQSTPELPLDGKFAILTPLIFSVSGIFSTFMALLGFTLIYWSASKAFGGHGGLMLVLELIGLAALPFWIISPTLNYALRFSPSAQIRSVLLILLIPFFFWLFRLLQASIIVGQGVSRKKAAIAIIAMAIFSVSSIYVFMP